MKSDRLEGSWEGVQGTQARNYRCAYCGERVASDRGWLTSKYLEQTHGEIRVCPHCNQPTFFRNYNSKYQIPGPKVRGPVLYLPADVAALYEEARAAHAAGAFTASVLALRKLLMHVAVEKTAPKGLKFIEYVEYLDKENYLGRDGKGWVDLIRTKSNETNHEITLMSADDSERLLVLAEMLLKLVYEFPGSLPPTTENPVQ